GLLQLVAREDDELPRLVPREDDLGEPPAEGARPTGDEHRPVLKEVLRHGFPPPRLQAVPAPSRDPSAGPSPRISSQAPCGGRGQSAGRSASLARGSGG